MRFAVLAILAAALSTAAFAAEPPSAQGAYVERRGLLEADTQCRLFTPEVRAALRVTALQARGALLRGGWSLAQMDDLELATVNAARARRCGDTRTISAAAVARQAYNTTFRSNAMEFPGWARAWSARRVAGAEGWRLRQTIAEPMPATFGVRESNGGEEFVLVLAVANERAAPTSAQLELRNLARNAAALDLAGRMARGLEAGAPSPGVAVSIRATARRVEHPSWGRTQIVFVFPAAAFRSLCALDPRESVVINLGASSPRRLLVEVGDVAAAQGFLATRAD